MTLLSSRTLTAAAAVAAALALGAVSVSAGAVAGDAATPTEQVTATVAPTVGHLTVEHQTDPLGIDTAHPRLGWTTTGAPGATQTAYEIRVSRTAGNSGDVWDSGKVSSPSSVDVSYAGPALQPRTRYFWRVRVWDGRVASPWTDAAWFETAFLDDTQFSGDWIGARANSVVASLQGANWIWYPEGDPSNSAPVATRYFRRDFDLPAGATITSADLQITADDNFVLYVNGAKVAASPNVANSWSTESDVDLTDELKPGANVIAVQSANTQPGPSSMIAKLHVALAGADPVDLVTDGSWKSSDSAQDGWEQPGFDDSAWPAAMVVDPYGSGPWGSSVIGQTPPEPLLRKEFDSRGRIVSARAYISGLGYYKLYLNGQKVGDHELDPAFTVYDKHVQYATYDVTKDLQYGDNAIGVSLGRGYYAMMSPDEWLASDWHGEPKVKLELDITYADGSTKQIVSDDSWKLSDGPTTAESLWWGETYDARLAQPGWNNTGFDDSSWRAARVVPAPTGKLVAESFPPIKVTGALTATSVTTPAPGTTVYDYGSPTAGWATIGVRGPAGAQVTITYGEKLNADGTVNNAGAFGLALQKDTYILSGNGLETYTPGYTYDGFQDVQVSVPAGVTLESVTGQRVHTAVQTTGGFASSSDLLNKYQDAEANTILNNLHSIPTDTPMYEKRGYTADGFLYANAAIDNFDMENFYENWMRDHRDDQTDAGTIGNTVPTTEGGKAITDPVWGSSYVQVDWDLYWYYGDTQAIADNYAGMKKWLEYYENDIASTGGIYTGFSYGDWLSPEGANEPEGTRLVATAYLYQDAVKLAAMARALGHDDDATGFDAFAARVKSDFNATFYDASAGAYYDDKSAGYRQTSNLLPLSFGLVPAADKATVLANLVQDIKTRGNHLDTGALGTKVLLPVLTENGHGDLAYQVATNPTYPGWGYWFTALGASTMWEEWDKDSRSHDHAFMGTADDWLYQNVAGIEPAAAGYTKVRIKPAVVGDLTHASGHVQTPLGQVASTWNVAGGVLTLNATIPVGATGKIYVPAKAADDVVAPAGAVFVGMEGGYAEYAVGSGTSTFHAYADGRP